MGAPAACLERGAPPGEPQGRLDAMPCMPRRLLRPSAPAKGLTRGKPLTLFGCLPRLPASTCGLRRLRPPPSGTGPAKVPRLPPAQTAMGHAHLRKARRLPWVGEHDLFNWPPAHRGHRTGPPALTSDPCACNHSTRARLSVLQVFGPLPVRRTFARPFLLLPSAVILKIDHATRLGPT